MRNVGLLLLDVGGRVLSPEFVFATPTPVGVSVGEGVATAVCTVFFVEDDFVGDGERHCEDGPEDEQVRGTEVEEGVGDGRGEVEGASEGVGDRVGEGVRVGVGEGDGEGVRVGFGVRVGVGVCLDIF